MKKFILEYVNVIGYVITGLVFSLAVFILFANFYHYKEVSTTYDKGVEYMNAANKNKESIDRIRSNMNVFDVNNYNGSIDKYSLSGIKSALTICANKFDATEANEIMKKQIVNIQDNYEFYAKFQSDIVNDCLVMQIYSLDDSKNPAYAKIKPYIDTDIKLLTNDLDYVKKVMQSNSSYQFLSDFDRVNVFNMTRDSYTRIELTYRNSLLLVESLSDWFRKAVEGGV